MDFTPLIESEEQLRVHYNKPLEGSLLKEKECLDDPSKEFIKNSPFLCLATTSPEGLGDCSPKGDAPGFVKILNDKTLAIPDRKGNNRLDSLTNILKEPKVGLLFFIPGRNETLRINGLAKISRNPDLLSELSFKNKQPTVVIIVEVKEVYLHCPKALIRSDLWKRGADIKDLKTYIRAIQKQLGNDLTEEKVAELAKNYNESLSERLY